MKRLMDFLLSFIGAIVLSPVMLVLAIIIKLTSRGPVLFKQRRIGKNKKEFLIYKFRTMRNNAPKDVPTHMLTDANLFITPVGRFMRRTSLDELPQVFNILRGQMSIVGPRPALYNQHDLISLRDRYGINRLRPGLTGWAQINGRDELPIPVKVEYDLYYLRNRSVWLDIKIILKTFGKAFRGSGIVDGNKM